MCDSCHSSIGIKKIFVSLHSPPYKDCHKMTLGFGESFTLNKVPLGKLKWGITSAHILTLKNFVLYRSLS